MKRILVPTDFSQYAENALRTAALIARENDSQIYLLHLIELPSHIDTGIKAQSLIPEAMLFIDKANETLQTIAQNSYLEGISVFIAVQIETAFDGILSYTKKNEIDLIVMGSNGASGLKEILIGSNAEKIVRLSDKPVLIVKDDIGTSTFKKIVFPTDFSNEAHAPFESLLKFASIFKSQIDLVVISTPNSFKTTIESEIKMEEFIQKYNFKNYTLNIFNDSTIENGITNFATKMEADLIAICTHGRTGIAHFINGSVTQDLVNHNPRPVITFKI
ncbi:universal stress protein [Flavobacterium weaverense]|uniref:Nucleotide-binding universal stress UspA family protein n=1 Tax=Flavobacterium weaverense TaxID=271156 RepID=A0A3L9ZZS4_9FLAO|nr:universal stress protein [Flavobacterium weaverense]RMA77807.1 nucleotide-binding universal stress UspA family protein [Flavobacterium weaverense]